MKKLLSLILVISLVSSLFGGVADARVRVHGYTKKNGTYVKPHYRSNPDRFKYNNYGYSRGR